MGTNNAVLRSAQGALYFDDDDLDWLIGEVNQAALVARSAGALLYRYDQALVKAALDFFRRYQARFVWPQERPDFESIRLTEEEWTCHSRQKLLRALGHSQVQPKSEK